MQIINSPFLLENQDIYSHWRDKKLSHYPRNITDLIVELKNPKDISKNEYKALSDLIKRANMVVYASNTDTNPDPQIPKAVASKFGLGRLNKNWLAEDNGLTALTVADDGIKKNYIPYTNRIIHWHTDGYYNASDKQIHALLLHTVQRADKGGENQLMDHEIAYILLREKNPDYIKALMTNDVMTIPSGTDMNGNQRPDRAGPVFSITKEGNLHMRYTARKRNVIWSKNPLVIEAIDYLQQILNDKSSQYVFTGLLKSGMGLISNNVLHNRAAFTDSEKYKRFYYRARYFDAMTL